MNSNPINIGDPAFQGQLSKRPRGPVSRANHTNGDSASTAFADVLATAIKGLTCRECGSKVEKLYQNDTCKPCLVKSFSESRSLIDHYRAGGGQG